MKRKKFLPLLIIFVTLVLILNIPKISSEKMRDMAVQLSAPFWKKIDKAKSVVSGRNKDELDPISRAEFQHLKLENQLLKKEIEKAYQLIDEVTPINNLLEGAPNGQAIARYRKNLKSLQYSKLEAVPAEVIYRAPTTWNSSLWINRGRELNIELGHEIIAKNSPVLAGSALIGVVDYVGKKQSRVRLITDSGLSLAVRATRGDPQHQRFSKCLDDLMNYLSNVENSTINESQKKQLLQQFKALKKVLLQGQECHMLAKGELHGSSLPLWRSNGELIKGVGFNYDFTDDEGPARDLRNGIPYGSKDPGKGIPLLKERDILITTGMDGVFPPGLQVAEVVSVGDLEEGDYAYELVASPIAGNLNEVSLLFVMPPIGFDPADQPSFVRETGA
ncbi:MAG: rod shape-determining protein MreC [Parachlamydiaceae bacterium]|nr:rod shape-determining protein MreC [Parachlamydiaceae bacterium]